MKSKDGTAPPGKAASGARDFTVPFVAALLVLSASFANFLSYNTYPLLRAEVLLVWFGLAAIAAVFGLLHARVRQFGRAILDGLLAFLAVDLNSDQVLIAAAAAAVFAFLRLGRDLSLLQPLSIVAGVVLASGAAGLTERRPPIARTIGNAPPPTQSRAILHIILDEHGGLGGAKGAAFRQQLADFYSQRGFRIFERAYSRHFHTVNAIPSVLNFGGPGESRSVNETLDIGKTRYLSGLEEQGYRLHFYQSDFADFCRYSRFASCTNYWSASMELVEPLSLPTGEKARLMALKLAALSDLVQGITGGIDDLTHLPLTRPLGIPVMAIKERAASSSLGGLATLDRMARDLKSAKPGDAYFAHILAPHHPYVMAGDCRPVEPSKWEYRRSSRPIAVREAAYRRQVNCLTKQLDKVVGAFLSSPAGKNAVIIIHGDHGSRITGMDPIEPNEHRLTPNDLMAGYATLFVVRGPELRPGIDPHPYASPDILRKLAASDFRSLDGISPGDGKVHLDGPDWTVGRQTSIAKAWPSPN